MFSQRKVIVETECEGYVYDPHIVGVYNLVVKVTLVRDSGEYVATYSTPGRRPYVAPLQLWTPKGDVVKSLERMLQNYGQ